MTHFRFPPDPAFPVPRARLDRIERTADALAVIALAVTQPLVDETIILVLDQDRRGSVVTAITGTRDPDDVFGVVDIFSSALDLVAPSSLVVASVRPTLPVGTNDDDRWQRLVHRASGPQVHVDEWFIIDARGATSMRVIPHRSRCHPREADSGAPNVSRPTTDVPLD